MAKRPIEVGVVAQPDENDDVKEILKQHQQGEYDVVTRCVGGLFTVCDCAHAVVVMAEVGVRSSAMPACLPACQASAFMRER
jgi:hypothetical protein